jgi:uncharacterized protein YdiU (UPF0061 family)
MNDATLSWRFDNRYVRLPEVLFVREQPTPVRQPKLVIFNDGLSHSLGLGRPSGSAHDRLAQQLAGNELPPGADPIAQAYAGHQFGHFNMLGDGRAVVLGEHCCPDGTRVDIQLKGSGRTPFSRRGDGRAALGPMLREYVISEAMTALLIPSTRSLAVTLTGEQIYREEVLAGAVLTRVASSHLRVGTFQYAAARRDDAALRALVDFAIERHYPECAQAQEPALALLRAVISRQTRLMVEWMRVGFIHGVMNTDNMSISGETIDYGPCAFLDVYDPETVFSSIDHGGRYAFVNQPVIAQWNLARFAESLLTLLHDDADEALRMAETEIKAFTGQFDEAWLSMMRSKLGLPGEEPEDRQLVDDWLGWMRDREVDYTNQFRQLCQGLLPVDRLTADPRLAAWHTRWQERRSRADEAGRNHALAHMRHVNPAYIARNHQVEAALAAAVQRHDLQPLHRLLEVLARPYEEREGLEEYAQPAPATAVPYQTFCGT